MELHGNEEACDGARMVRGPWEWRLTRGLPFSEIGHASCALDWSSVRSIAFRLCSSSTSVELVGMRSRSLHTRSLQHSSPTPIVQRQGSSPAQPWRSLLTRAFAGSKPLPIPPPDPSMCVPYPPSDPGERRLTGAQMGRQPRPSPSQSVWESSRTLVCICHAGWILVAVIMWLDQLRKSGADVNTH